MISNIEKTKTYQLNNHNALLNTMEGVIAGKTGFTCDAGYCYVGAVERDGAIYICALLGCGWPNNKNYKWYDMNVLIDYAEDKCRKVEVPEKMETVQKKTSKETEPITETGIITEEIVMKEGEQLKLIYELPTGLQAPVTEDEAVGKIHYTINGQTLFTESLTVGTTIYKMEFPDYFKLTGRCFILNDQTSSSAESNSSEKCVSQKLSTI